MYSKRFVTDPPFRYGTVDTIITAVPLERFSHRLDVQQSSGWQFVKFTKVHIQKHSADLPVAEHGFPASKKSLVICT